MIKGLAAGLVGCGLLLSGCDAVTQDAAPDVETADLSGGETLQEGERQIDWVAARQARIEAIDAGVAQDNALIQVQGAGLGSPVPVMLPTGIVVPANEQPLFATSGDGYFASYPGAIYDIIVNGTNEVWGDSSEDLDDAARQTPVFTQNEAGAQVSFSRFGADYLVEFECNILNGENSCITEEQALSVIEGLFVAVADE